MASLAGKVIAITGAASGIGRATARTLYSRGASVALSDVSTPALAALSSELSVSSANAASSSREASATAQKVTHRVVNVSKTEAVNAWIEEIMRDFGRLDGAANVAGVFPTIGGIVDTSDEEWDRVVGVNAGGVFKCLRAELKHVADGGSIVNVTSLAGLTGFPGNSSYVASKHAVVGLTKTAAKEGGPKKIRVNAVAPGYIKTPMLMDTAKATGDAEAAINLNIVPLGRVAEPEEVGNSIAWLLSNDSSYVNGEVIRVDGGWLS